MSRRFATRNELWVANAIWWGGSFLLIFIMSWRLAGELRVSYQVSRAVFDFLKETRDELAGLSDSLVRLEASHTTMQQMLREAVAAQRKARHK